MAQLLVPLAIIIGVPAAQVKLPVHQVHLANAGLMWLPLIAVAIVAAYRYMDSLTEAKADKAPYIQALKNRQTWVMSFLYIGTFGSFIGYSFALPLVIKTTFPDFLAEHPFIATYLAGLGFVGALIGSLSRPLGGWLADKIGGARVTLGVFVGAALFTATAINGVQNRNFALFFASYMVIFLLVGHGQRLDLQDDPEHLRHARPAGSGDQGLEPKETALNFKQQAAAVIGIAGAIGAFGGFLIQVVLRQANLDVAALVKAAKTPAEKVAVAAHTPTGRSRRCRCSSPPTSCSP